jgi:hypothetical protein
MRDNETYKTQHVLRVYGDDKDAFLEIGEDRDHLGLIEIRTTTEDSVNYYGNTRLPLTPKLAKMLGLALIKLAGEMDEDT